MDINIRISLDAPVGWKRRLLLYVGVPVALVGAASAVAHAYDTSWVGDTKPVSASALKGNLDEIQSRLYALEGGSTVLGVTTAEVVGASLGTTFDGPGSGYASARAQCQAAFPQASSAHMCVASEVVDFLSRGGQMPTTDGAWYGTGLRHDGADATNVHYGYHDCMGFTSAAGTSAGVLFRKNAGGTGFTYDYCHIAHAILCCK